jgi:hypothetical protein
MQQKATDETMQTWIDLNSELHRTVQGPVLSRYENYFQFFNFEFRSTDTVNSFLLQLGKKESVLEHSFFKKENGVDDYDKLKIAYVWLASERSHLPAADA